MLDHQPTEIWEYQIGDIIRGFSVAAKLKNPDTELFLEGLGKCIPTRSARAAIVVALEALSLRPGAHIGVPLYCCPVVFKAILASGCVPRFIDIESDTFCLSPEDLSAKSAEIDALIAVHMFGNMCDMPTLKAIMRGKPIIEDCAQSIGSKFNDRPAGSFGEIAVFSFRSGKYLSVGEGGALFTRQDGLRQRMLGIIHSLPGPSLLAELKHILATYIRSKLRSKRLWGVVGIPIWKIYNKNVEFVSKSPISLSRHFISDLALAQKRMRGLNIMIEAHRRNAEFYLHNLELDSDQMCREKPGSYYNRYMFPMTLSSSEQRDQIAEKLADLRVGTAKPYEDVGEGAAKHYGYSGDCPTTESLTKRILIIPSHYKLKQEDIARIARILNDGWRRKRAHRPKAKAFGG
jgi:dTDP-4-amino-4,6-dideoxygalactose transaminase